ncbi:MAG: hypothetical protein DPW14_09595 [Planctomycetes bacterium]|nr:hypothetical protein [Planctomycetota bacterium]
MAKVGRPRKRRHVTPHRGVKILQRHYTTGVFWFARWRDPITGKPREMSLDKEKCTSSKARVAWAKNKAAELQKYKERGPSAVRQLKEAIKSYFEERNKVLRDATREAYTYALTHFQSWADKAGVVFCGQLKPPLLADLHGYISTLPKREAQSGKKVGRGAYKLGTKILSAASRNQILRGCHTFLTYIRKRGLTPEITSDDITDQLPYIRGESAPVRFLRSEQIAALLGAAARHDAAKFAITREEHDGERDHGTTPRYQAIRPFILVTLLSGMRFAEAAGLLWREVDLKAGEIVLDAKRVKTKQGRVIRLKSSPLLWQTLRELRLQSGGSETVFQHQRWNAEKKKWEPAPGMSRDVAETARVRLMRAEPKKEKGASQAAGFGAPEFSWHDLRRTAATYLVNMPGANIKQVADHLGHSTALAEKLYWGRVELSGSVSSLDEAIGLAQISTSLAAPSAGVRS